MVKVFSLSLLALMCAVYAISVIGHDHDPDDHDDHDHDADNDFVGFHNVATMPFAVSDMTATLLDSNGPRVYVVGGCISDQQCEPAPWNDPINPDDLFCTCRETTSKCNYFTPDDQMWHTDCADGTTPRYRHKAAAVQNTLYVAGGRTVEDSIIKTVDKYDVEKNLWETVATWDTATSDGAAFSYNSKLYLVGGWNADYSLAETALVSLNVDTLVWDMSHAAMPFGVGDIVATPFGGINTFYVLGGWTHDDFCAPKAYVQVYDAPTNKWTVQTPLELPRGDMAVGVMDNSLFAIGGEKKEEGDVTCSRSAPVSRVERFNMTAWDEEEDIPADVFRFSSASYEGTSSTSAIYLFGGQGTYDPVTKSFPVRDYTIKYIPASTVHSDSDKDLDDGEIAGIAVAAIVVVIALVLMACAYMEYRRRGYYTNLEKQEAEATAPIAGDGLVKANPQGIEMVSAAAVMEEGVGEGDLTTLSFANRV